MYDLYCLGNSKMAWLQKVCLSLWQSGVVLFLLTIDSTGVAHNSANAAENRPSS